MGCLNSNNAKLPWHQTSNNGDNDEPTLNSPAMKQDTMPTPKEQGDLSQDGILFKDGEGKDPLDASASHNKDIVLSSTMERGGEFPEADKSGPHNDVKEWTQTETLSEI